MSNRSTGHRIPFSFHILSPNPHFPIEYCHTHGSGLAAGCKAKQRKGNTKPGWSLWRAMLVDGLSAAVRAWPLAALGASRLVVVKGLDYQEHVSEYGVHWNFFATLFFLRIVVVPMNRLHPARLRLLLALVAMCVYQWWLVNGGLSDFIVHAPRETLFSMNREGVLGLVGFVAIYYIAEELGSRVRTGREKTEKVRSSNGCSVVLCCSSQGLRFCFAGKT